MRNEAPLTWLRKACKQGYIEAVGGEKGKTKVNSFPFSQQGGERQQWHQKNRKKNRREEARQVSEEHGQLFKQFEDKLGCKSIGPKPK